MSGKKTLIIAIVFLAAAGGFWLDQQRHAKQEERQVAESRVLSPKADALTGLTVKRGGKLQGTLKLAKEDKYWKLVEPIRSRADADGIKSLLDALDSAKRTEPFDPAGGKLDGYGLTTPTLTVSFSTGHSKESLPDLQVGDETPDDNAIYARLSDRRQVFTIGKDVARALGATPQDLRDKRLLPANLTEATSIALEFEGQRFELHKSGGHWNLVSPRKLKADDNAVADILSKWNKLRTQTFLDTASGVSLMKAGLAYPYVAASAYVNGDDGLKTYTMLVGDVATSIPILARYAMRRSELLPIFMVNDSLANKLRPTLDALRDKALFTLESPDVGKIDLTSIHHRMPLARGSDGKWRLTDDPKAPIDQSTIGQKLNGLLSMKAMRFFDEEVSAVKTGLDDPNVIVTLASKDGKTSQTLETGRKAEDADFVYCRFSDASGRRLLIGVDWKLPGDYFLTRQDLLDKALFAFKPEQVARMTIQDGKTSATLRRLDSGGWEFQKLGPDGKPTGDKNTVEPITTNNFLQSASGLEWKRRLDPADEIDKQEIEKFHLDVPTRWIAFYDAKDVLLARMGQGDSDDELARVKIGSGACYAIDGFRMIGYLEELRRIWRFAGVELQPLKQGASPEATSDKAKKAASTPSPEMLDRVKAQRRLVGADEQAPAAKAGSKPAVPNAATANAATAKAPKASSKALRKADEAKP
jgi:hypothetical protein